MIGRRNSLLVPVTYNTEDLMVDSDHVNLPAFQKCVLRS